MGGEAHESGKNQYRGCRAMNGMSEVCMRIEVVGILVNTILEIAGKVGRVR